MICPIPQKLIELFFFSTWFDISEKESMAGVSGRWLSCSLGKLKVYGFEPHQTAEELNTFPQVNRALQHPLSNAHWESLWCTTDAHCGASCSLPHWLSKLRSFWINCEHKFLSEGTSFSEPCWRPRSNLHSDYADMPLGVSKCVECCPALCVQLNAPALVSCTL